jgi:hypothetical protein
MRNKVFIAKCSVFFLNRLAFFWKKIEEKLPFGKQGGEWKDNINIDC